MADVAPLSATERRLRRALVLVALIAALLAVIVGAVLVILFRWVLPTTPDPFTRGPYVVSVGTTTATLRWRVEGDRPVEIVATAPDGRTLVARDGRLTGLTPGTRQGWVAVVDGLVRASGSVTTAPVDPAATVRFVAFGDYGAGGDDAIAVARLGSAQSPAFTVVPGDNVYLLAHPALFDRMVFRPMRPLLAQGPFVATLGEHDRAWNGGADIAEALGLPNGGERYVFDHGPVRIVVVGLEADDGDVPFVRAALDDAPSRRVYLVTHRAPGPDNPVLAVARGRVRAVISGHNHRYERRVIDGVQSLTVGTGGAPRNGDGRFTPRSSDAVASLAEFGLVRIDDRAAGARVVFLDVRGRVRDRAVLR